MGLRAHEAHPAADPAVEAARADQGGLRATRTSPARSRRPPVAEGFYKNGICVGSPDEVARTIARFEAIGLDQLVLIPVVGWHTPHEKTLESIRLLGEKVLPRFRRARG